MTLNHWVGALRSSLGSDSRCSTDTFLQLNDSINSVLTRYEAFKKGDYSIAAAVPPELAGSSTQAQSLIDFDDSEAAGPSNTSAAPINDLAGLFSAPSPPQVTSNTSPPSLVSPFTAAFGTSSGVPAYNSFAAPAQQQPQPFAPQPILATNGANSGYTNQLFGQSRTPSQSTATPPAAIRLTGGTPVINPSGPSTSSTPNYFNNAFTQGPVATNPQGSFGGFQQPSQPLFQQMTPQPAATPAQPANQAPTQQNKDPFADLAGLF